MSEITLRELFAAHALQGLLASGHYTTTYTSSRHPDPVPIFVEETEEFVNAVPECRAAAANQAWIIADHMLTNINREIPECSP
jgi:hypothetical protein